MSSELRSTDDRVTEIQRVDLLERAEVRRAAALARLDPTERAARGQYLTPQSAARIIAGLPRVPRGESIRILDPGAGSGILTAALVERLYAARPDLRVHVTTVENDTVLHPVLSETLADIEAATGATSDLVDADFLSWALGTAERYDLVIQNPPYAKLRTGCAAQVLLRSAGINVPNVYAAFLAVGLRILGEGGQQVAITPRSWMNGTYYSAFRREFVRLAGIDAMHTFESRSKVFGDAGVLQESIVVSATVGRTPDEVVVHTSRDHSTVPSTRTVAYQDIVTPDFIHVPAAEKDAQAVAWMTTHVTHTLQNLGLSVSTGRVVDFRARDLLHQDQVEGAVPMVNATHLRGGVSRHPVGAKKPEWFHAGPATASRLLVPGGTYVLIKRFSAKEERRRVVAAVWQSSEDVAFDNKLNYIHEDGHGLDEQVARGLVVFLNSTQLDSYFRVFSGHTQVNATDLRQMRFPSFDQLRELGEVDPGDQLSIDATTESVLASVAVTA
ncbi:adenine-specific DNA-methyltransferase [Murinocardiopsis flavida]|uniref:site-specific DNA-methyltransferase (adenine-specific) n=1 Tax=Murinocardiopsis flavida TaxID=645275 RepID=A0A2P8D8T5_9ACTN|nr:Eco57I restriction-modification methylase domain-containing protein [Murinocardiopsis flavida]PSK93622.1 adenine-specific DNA-methyltransferase [Murinocardiopsis flavida]